LNEEIDLIFEHLTPEAEEMDNLKKTYNEFEKVIKKVMDQNSFEYDLVIYGSSVNGLTMRGNSDLDLSLVIHNLPDKGSI
jgi:tRNA nucleotidyltransferase (CCA-adding enzyme)